MPSSASSLADQFRSCLQLPTQPRTSRCHVNRVGLRSHLARARDDFVPALDGSSRGQQRSARVSRHGYSSCLPPWHFPSVETAIAARPRRHGSEHSCIPAIKPFRSYRSPCFLLMARSIHFRFVSLFHRPPLREVARGVRRRAARVSAPCQPRAARVRGVHNPRFQRGCHPAHARRATHTRAVANAR